MLFYFIRLINQNTGVGHDHFVLKCVNSKDSHCTSLNAEPVMTFKVSFLFVLFFFKKGEDQIGSHVSSSSDTWNIPSACLILWHSLLLPSSIVVRRPSVIRKKNLWKITGRIRLRCTAAAAAAAATTTQTLRLHSPSFNNVRYGTVLQGRTRPFLHNTIQKV